MNENINHVEKRRKLLGALEKCDDDLQTLRRIIAAVRAGELRSAAASDVSLAPAGEGKGAKWMDGSLPLQKKPWAEAQYPSPDSGAGRHHLTEISMQEAFVSMNTSRCRQQARDYPLQ